MYVLVELLKHIKTTCQMWGTIELLRDPIFKSALRELKKVVRTLSYVYAGLHKLWYPGIRDMSTWSKFGAHGEHEDVFLFSNLGAL